MHKEIQVFIEDFFSKCEEMCILNHKLFYSFNEVRYNCSAHRSADLFKTATSSHSHKERKKPQRIFLQYSCSVTTIYIVKNYL